MSKTETAQDGMERRTFLAGAAAATAALAAPEAALAQSASVDNIPIIDAHIHLFDNTTPLGAGYMGSAAYKALNKPSLPSMYAPLAKPTGIVGAIVVESSAFYDDNLFYLETARANPIMVGVSGTLNPASPEFGRYVTHFQKDPLYRAIRASRFYDTANSSATDSFTNPAAGRGGGGGGRGGAGGGAAAGGGGGGGGGGRRGNDDGKVTLNQTCVNNLKLLAEADLALDTANPSMNLMTANVLLANAVPNLRVIMDHLPSFDPTPANQQAYEAVIKEMAACPNLFVKLTEVYHPRTADGVIVKDYEFLRARLEYLYDAFGEDRVMFGSDYPNSYGVATIPEEVGLMKQFFSTKTRMQAEKYFWRNSAHIYKWVRRNDTQPDPAKA